MLKSSIIIFAGLAIIVVACAAAMVYFDASFENYKRQFIPNGLNADKLSDKPEKYFVLTNPDPALLNAIFHPEESILVRLNETDFDELMDRFGTNNVEYQSNYYSVYILFLEPSSTPREMRELSFFAFAASIGLLVSYVVFQGLVALKKKKSLASNRNLNRNLVCVWALFSV